MRLILTRDIALGNGTRRRGEVLAQFEGTVPEELEQAAAMTDQQDLSGFPGTIELAHGVTPYEVLTALRNPELRTFEHSGEDSGAALADMEPTDVSPPALAAPPAKAPKPRRSKRV